MMAAMVALMALLAAGVTQVPPDPDLGISEALARNRAARVSNLRYELSFTIPAALSYQVSLMKVTKVLQEKI
jgi:hypothetical protein